MAEQTHEEQLAQAYNDAIFASPGYISEVRARGKQLTELADAMDAANARQAAKEPDHD